jgi:hypothetical protein
VIATAVVDAAAVVAARKLLRPQQVQRQRCPLRAVRPAKVPKRMQIPK